MDFIKKIAFIGTLLCVGSIFSSTFNPTERIRSNNYTAFMQQYKGREYQIITMNNLINMNWFRGAVNAVYQDGYRQDSEILNTLWYHIAGVVDFTANLPENRNNHNFRQRIWESLTRSMDELRRQTPMRALPSVPTTPVRPSSAPVSQMFPAAPTRALPALPISLTLDSITNGSLGNDYASKAREILSYNYDKAARGGFINLANALRKDIVAINEDNSSSQQTKIADMQRAVNRYYTALGKYRIRDKQ